jgi:predicted transglutaminase-like cysteine proteinase
MALYSPRRTGCAVILLVAALAVPNRAPAAQFIFPEIPTVTAPVAPTVPAVSPPGPGFSDGLFGQHTVSTAEIGPFPRWQKVIERFAEQRANPTQFCASGDSETCPPAIWQKLVAKLATLPLNERIALANDFFNRVPYIRAEVNWGDAAYWETPFEFLTRGGQCQDYAIAKYLALRESGVPEEQLRFVVVHDNYVGLDHAITVVNLDNQAMALDNQMLGVTPVADLTQRYAPYYALNDEGWSAYATATEPAVMYTVRPTAVSFSSSFRVARY